MTPKALLARIVLACSLIAGVPTLALADCDVITQAAKRGSEAEKTKLSKQEAATKEAVDNLKACLERINTALNRLIPGVPSITPADFSAILNNLMNRACQVVTTKIDQAGNVVQGTVSDAANRFIGDINKAIDPTGALGTSVLSSTGTQSITSSYQAATTAASTVSTATTTSSSSAASQASIWDKLSCYFSSSCK